MDSFLDSPFNEDHQSQHQNSGLLRFRSAPISLHSNFDKVSAFSKSYDYNQSFESVESKPLVGQTQLPPQYPDQSLVSTSGAMDGTYRVEGSMEMEQSARGKVVTGSNLTRQSSSPAGFFLHLNAQIGYPLKRQISGLSSTVHHLPRIPEIGGENVRETSDTDGRLYGSGFSYPSWNDSAQMVEDAVSPQNRTHVLSHHLSLPKTSAEMTAIEKLLHFQDSVPCKIRAKRGCATHPRSIAERVRRTRISERMKKLQDLVPNMEKQMNTADMLDFAVDYIKELQEQYKTLSDNRARCTCLSGQKAASSHAV